MAHGPSGQCSPHLIKYISSVYPSHQTQLTSCSACLLKRHIACLPTVLAVLTGCFFTYPHVHLFYFEVCVNVHVCVCVSVHVSECLCMCVCVCACTHMCAWNSWLLAIPSAIGSASWSALSAPDPTTHHGPTNTYHSSNNAHQKSSTPSPAKPTLTTCLTHVLHPRFPRLSQTLPPTLMTFPAQSGGA